MRWLLTAAWLILVILAWRDIPLVFAALFTLLAAEHIAGRWIPTRSVQSEA